MRKLVLFIISLVSVSITSFSQKAAFSYEPSGAKTAKSLPYQSYLIHDKMQGKTTLIVKDNEQAEYMLLGKDFRIEEKIQPVAGLSNTIFKTGWHKYLTGTANNLGTCFYYSVQDKSLNNGGYHIRMEIVDFKNKTVSNKMVFAIPGGERTIDWFTNDGIFYLMTSNDNANQFVFHIVDRDGNVSTKNIAVDLGGFNKEKLTVSEYFSYAQVFQENEEIELVAGTELTKLYVRPHELVMVVTNAAEPPHIWTIDLEKYVITSKRKLDMTGFAGFSGKKEKFYNNSFLYGDKLYLFHTSKSKIEVGVFDFTSGKLLKKNEITESSAISFVETPVEVITRGRATKRNVINSNKELINRVSKGSTGIAVATNSRGNIILTCGAYDREERSTGGYYAGGFGASSRPTGSTYSGSNVPVMRTYSNFNSMANYKGGNVYTYTRTISFKLVLDTANFDIISGSQTLSVLDKINAFIEKVDEKAQAENVLRIGNNYYVCYYDSQSKAFSIQQIEL